jgi:hypothetical protein
VVHQREENSRTKRCSEREPADWLRDKSSVIGGWLPSLTFTFGGTVRTMKTKYLILSLVSALAVGACMASVPPSLRHRAEWKWTVHQLRGLSFERMIEALRAFTRDHRAGGSGSAPHLVSIGDLVFGGYLRGEEIGSLADEQVVFLLAPLKDRPQFMWIRAKLPDRSLVAEIRCDTFEGLGK